VNALDETTTRRIGKLMRMLSSSFEGEVHNALRKLKELLEAEGLTFSDIATAVENHQGEFEERKYSDADAEAIFARGVEKGRAEQTRKPPLASDFYDEDRHPRWTAMAMFCLERRERMRPNELQFVEDMAAYTLSYEPSEKQGKWLLAIFIKLGGMRQ
jgi:hypothetical protein